MSLKYKEIFIINIVNILIILILIDFSGSHIEKYE
jgi:hypothetical protein